LARFAEYASGLLKLTAAEIRFSSLLAAEWKSLFYIFACLVTNAWVQRL